MLEQARFGDRLAVTLRIAPEVLPVAVPFLAVQPLVENAVRHGLEGKDGAGHITITAADHGAEAEISIEDDGVGSDPEPVRAVLAGDAATATASASATSTPGCARSSATTRPRRRDRARRRHQGDLPGAQVRPGHPRRNLTHAATAP